MLRRRFFSLLVGLVALSTSTAQAAADPQAILAASDAIRNPSQGFRVTVTLSEFEKGKLAASSTLLSFSRVLDGGGQFATILKFLQPARDVGKMMLKNGSDLWFFDPNTKASVRISPQQRLIGQAANGDVVTVNFARDYKAVILGEETVQDGERKERQARRLQLTASTDDATYGSIELWLDRDSHAPIKAKFFADSGRLMKSAYYRRYQSQLGAMRPTETVIIDGLDPQSVTIVRLTDFELKSLPSSQFHREYLPRFSAD